MDGCRMLGRTSRLSPISGFQGTKAMTLTACLTDAQFLLAMGAVCVLSLFTGAGLAVMVVCWPAMGPEDESEPYGDVPRSPHDT